MKFSDLVLVTAVLVVPVWLAILMWLRYIRLGDSSAGDLSQMRIGLLLVSATTIMWIAVFALMSLEDRSAAAKQVARNISPGLVGLVNLSLCIGGLVCSRFGRRTARETVALRSAMGLCSGWLMVLWLFITANPH